MTSCAGTEQLEKEKCIKMTIPIFCSSECVVPTVVVTAENEVLCSVSFKALSFSTFFQNNGQEITVIETHRTE